MRKITAFTLTEILIVLVIISAIAIIIPKIDIKLKEIDLKDKILSINFKKTLDIKCIDNCNECLVYIDNNLTKKIKLFNSNIKVYDKNLNEKVFDSIEIDFEIKDVCFGISLNSSKRFDDFIIYQNGKYYLYSYLEDKKVFDSLEDIKDYNQNLIQEIKDAF